ncbi:MAG: Enoyl-CoA hydratase [Ilumatobacteraceae bacterium]|nr:Enoyl-CoA hydratase [Ilumatobacteraceae bacterium]
MADHDPIDEASDVHIRAVHAGSTLTITIDHPERRNALSIEMIATMIDHLDAAVFDDDVRVVVLRSEGADFSTGADLGESNRSKERPRPGNLQRRMQHSAHRLIRTLHELQLPVVAAVSGWAAGLGNALALSADVVVADETATFWVPYVGKGFTPDSANSYLLPRLVGLARAKEMILRSKPISADIALEWGMISRVVPVGELAAAVDEVAAEFAAAATLSVGLAKMLIHRNLETDLTDALQNESIYEELAVRSDDFKEGMRAFAQKRPPDYTGW